MLHLLEQQLYLPTPTVYVYDFGRVIVRVVGQQRHKSVLALIRTGYYACVVRRRFPVLQPLGEGDMLYPHLHKPVGSLPHTVLLDGELQGFLHFCYVCHLSLRELFKLLIVNICPVHGHDVAFVQRGGLEHERIVRGGRCEPYVRWHALIGIRKYASADIEADAEMSELAGFRK